MKKNVGGIDKIIRTALGLGLIALVFVGPQTLWGWLGIVPLLTGIFDFCPFYPLFKLSTYRKP